MKTKVQCVLGVTVSDLRSKPHLEFLQVERRPSVRGRVGKQIIARDFHWSVKETSPDIQDATIFDKVDAACECAKELKENKTLQIENDISVYMISLMKLKTLYPGGGLEGSEAWEAISTTPGD